MRPHEIADFLKIYGKHDTRDAFYYNNSDHLWDQGLRNVEEYLLNKKQEMNPKLFGSICWCITDQEIAMPGFVLGMQKEVEGWLKDEKIMMDDLAAILRAYRLADVTCDQDSDNTIMLKKIETFAIEHFLHLSPN